MTSIRLDYDAKLSASSAILRDLESKFSAIYHNIKDKSKFKILYDKFEAEITFHGSCFNLLQVQGCPSPSSKLEILIKN